MVEEITSKFISNDQMPLVYEPKKPLKREQFFDLLKHNHLHFKEELLKYGALLFRNFPIDQVEDFGSLISALKIGEPIDYIGGDSPRNKVKGNIYTSTEAPPSMKIPLHNEMSFVKYYPTHICFYCERPSPEGGSTIIADARKVYQSIDDAVKQPLVNKGLKYFSRYYHNNKLMDFIYKIAKGHKPWINVFETNDKSEVERKCRENEFEFKWNRNEWIEIAQRRPAVMAHPKTQEMVWFNQAHLYDFNPKLLGFWNYIGANLLYFRRYTRLHEVFYGDESKIPRQHFYHILDMLDKNTISFPWQKGDVLVLDNVLAMHGRSTFKGKRRILTAMTKMPEDAAVKSSLDRLITEDASTLSKKK